MSEPKPTYTLDAGDVQFYVKPTSNCEGLALTTLAQLFGGEWSAERFRADSILLKTGEELTPRFVVGWTDLYGGIACQLAAYERIGDDDLPAVAIVGGNSGLRILANMDEGAVDPDDHLPPGWGAPVLLIEDFDDIVDERLRAALDLDTNVPDYEPPDWNAGADRPTYTQLLNRLKDIMLALRVSDLLDSDDLVWLTLRSVRKDMFNNPPIEGLEAEIEAAAQRVITAAPDDWYWHTWKADATAAGDDLPAELDFEQLAEIARAWPWSTRDAFGRWLGAACDRAGITDKRARLALQAELAALFGE